MSFKTMILGLAVAAGVALPGAASAQSWGGYYGQPRYGYQDYRYGDRYDRHDRKRWEQRRRWEEKQRRREWRHHRRYADRYHGDRY